jgi:hypothetical protein
MDFKAIIQDYVDYLMPRLDCYEQTLYVYLHRHTIFVDSTEVTVGFKSARLKMGFGVGTRGHGMSEGTCYEKLKTLHKKGYIQILDTTTSGTKVRVLLPAEISGVVPTTSQTPEINIEEMDFFDVAKNREFILEREGYKCFYCLRTLSTENYVIEHVSPRATSGNGYRNVVAGCRSCNNRKNDLTVEEFLRNLYREELLSSEEFADRTSALERLRAGELKPKV